MEEIVDNYQVGSAPVSCDQIICPTKDSAQFLLIDRKSPTTIQKSRTTMTDPASLSSSLTVNNHRKRRRTEDNPLSVARGKKKAESLWHRKSGAGFSLFVQFYSQHVDAVCVPTASQDALVKGSQQQQQQHQRQKQTTINSAGAGLSRAAKRRKKKKGKASPTAPTDATTMSSPSVEKNSLEPPPPSDAKLLVALEKLNDPIRQNASFRSFLTALSNPLPLTFRLRRRQNEEDNEDQVCPTLETTRNAINTQFAKLVAPLDFDHSIYQAKSCTLSKETLGKVSPSLKEFLVKETKRGTLARQEFGSMLPVLVLSRGGYISKGSRVLDLCASPGSKTLQALEVVGARGKLKANDINESRLQALREAVGRSGVPHVERIKYTMHDASQYPIPKTQSRLFDAVICDVPCSGDGTIRKDPHILPGWTPHTSNALHALQVRILKRAIQCVKVGGVVSYSTCSLNPVEDEAVVCAALTAFENQNDESKQGPVVQLIDWPEIKGFCARPGVPHWQVADYNGAADDDDDEPRLRWHATFQQATQHDMVDACASMWPPTVAPAGLEKCVRLHPQDHDSGGFFVALLKRIR